MADSESGRDVNVTFLPDNISFKTPRGTNLLKAASMAGVEIYSNCGGQGSCGKCRVIIKSGKFEMAPSTHLGREELDKGAVISCLTSVEGDLLVDVPVESRMREGKKIAVTSSLGYLEDLLKKEGFSPDPITKSININVPPPSLDDNISDLDRIKRELDRIGIDGEGMIFPFSLVKGLGSALRQDWSLTMTLLDYKGRVGAIDIRPGHRSKRRFGVAVDIGTTSIVVYLVDMVSGKVIGTSSSYNAQVKCGDDVISRIVYTEREGGLEHINSLVIDNINGLIGQVTRDHQVEPSDIELMITSGNTTMTHLFFAVDPKYIREEPYIPTANLFPHVRAGDLGIKINEDAVVYAVPGVASYVGGDITSGILASGLYKSSELSLFIDIGTNGEIVLGNEDWLMTTACSAGPCFEGGGVRNGMRATEGAIEEVIIDPDNYDVKLGVIGNTRPIGICGSGMIDAVAEMFLTGVIDQRGKIQRDINSNRILEKEDGLEFVLAWGNESGTGKEIALTEPDLDNIIRAKGAIYAGFSILLKEAGIDFSAIEKIMIAGGFGKYINVKRAIMIGLLPDLPPEKFVFLGNTSIAGAYLALTSREMLSRAEEIAKKMTYIELSVSRSFMDEYVSALFLPHTNIAAFPSVQGLLKGNTT
ncbi:MAG: DUF4445 domain-containing protein [Nitrospirae bacterium]|nr:DUF4445 domain-containing protein [Nitrospirota bacterium]